MQKISGILPNTPRISSVDMKDGQAARPGGPSFGRMVGSSSGPGRQALETTAQVAHQRHEELLDRRSKDLAEADIVKRLSDSFFMKRLDQPQSLSQQDGFTSSAPSQSLQKNSNSNSSLIIPSSVSTEKYQDPNTGEMLDGEFIPPGSYLNLNA